MAPGVPFSPEAPVSPCTQTQAGQTMFEMALGSAS